jgi:hypothetical protein
LRPKPTEGEGGKRGEGRNSSRCKKTDLMQEWKKMKNDEDWREEKMFRYLTCVTCYGYLRLVGLMVVKVWLCLLKKTKKAEGVA